MVVLQTWGADAPEGYSTDCCHLRTFPRYVTFMENRVIMCSVPASPLSPAPTSCESRSCLRLLGGGSRHPGSRRACRCPHSISRAWPGCPLTAAWRGQQTVLPPAVPAITQDAVAARPVLTVACTPDLVQVHGAARSDADASGPVSDLERRPTERRADLLSLLSTRL